MADLLGHEGPVWQVAWGHPKFGALLASASFDHRVIVWKEGPDGAWSQVQSRKRSFPAAVPCGCTHTYCGSCARHREPMSVPWILSQSEQHSPEPRVSRQTGGMHDNQWHAHRAPCKQPVHDADSTSPAARHHGSVPLTCRCTAAAHTPRA
jgi:hypothetical protein